MHIKANVEGNKLNRIKKILIDDESSSEENETFRENSIKKNDELCTKDFYKNFDLKRRYK